MYSESDLEAAVAGGALTPDQAASFRNFVAAGAAFAGRRRGAFPAADRFQRHLRRHCRRDPSGRGRLDRADHPAAHRRRRAVAVRRPVRRDHRLGPRRIFHPPAAHGAALDPLAGRLRRRRRRHRGLHFGHRDRNRLFRSQRPGLRPRLCRRAQRLPPSRPTLHWRRFRVPVTVAVGVGAAVALVLGIIASMLIGDAQDISDARGEQIKTMLRGGRPGARPRHLPARHVVGRIGSAPRDPPLGRRLLAAPAGGAADRPPDLLAARPHRGRGLDRRRRRRDPALRRARHRRACDRPPCAARLGARLCAVRAEQPVRDLRRRSSSTSRSPPWSSARLCSCSPPSGRARGARW